MDRGENKWGRIRDILILAVLVMAGFWYLMGWLGAFQYHGDTPWNNNDWQDIINREVPPQEANQGSQSAN